MGNRTIHFALLFAGVQLLVSSAEASQDERPPNVVLFLADDLGWTGLGCFGSDLYETPHLDRLAASGMRFTDAYAACTVCSPTRAAIMTGIYPARLHLTDFIAGQHRPWARMLVPEWTKFLETRHVTIAERLHAADYATLQVGKWHLGPRRGAGGQPSDHGFERQVLRPREARGYSLPQGFNERGESKSDYLTDYLTDEALRLIDECHDRPFFLYFAYHTPHTPIQGRADLVEQFRAKVRPDAVHRNPTYAAMVASLDMSVGRVLERLERHGLTERTLVIFTSDNGGLTQRYGKHDGFTENLPLRRGKGSAYEGGVRVPTIIRWPGTTEPGSVSNTPTISMDLLPTISEVTRTGAGNPSSVDGRSLVPVLRDPDVELDRDLFWHYPHYHAGGDGPYSAIRSGPWRLVEFHEDRKAELYNLATDAGEQRNLASEEPQRVAELLGKLERWREAAGAQMPAPNPEHDPSRETRVKQRR